MKDLPAERIHEKLSQKVAGKYTQREIEYPVEFAMNMVFGPRGANVYGFLALAEWAKKKYDADLSAEQLRSFAYNLLGEILYRRAEARALDDDRGPFYTYWNGAADAFARAFELDRDNPDAKRNAAHVRRQEPPEGTS